MKKYRFELYAQNNFFRNEEQMNFSLATNSYKEIINAIENCIMYGNIDFKILTNDEIEMED